MKTNILNNIGLNKNEVIIYETLLSNGEMIASDIAEKSKVGRQNTYAVLKSLVSKELVEEFTKKKKLTYRLEPPQKLLEYVEKRKEELEEKEKTISSLLPTLMSEYNLAHNKPGVSYFEGKEGLSKILEDIYSPGKNEVYGCANIDLVDKSFDEVFKYFIPQRVKNNLFAKTILEDSSISRALKQNDSKQHRKTMLVDNKKYPLPAEIDIYEDKIAMLDFSKGKFSGVIIENKSMAESLRSIFKLAFGD